MHLPITKSWEVQFINRFFVFFFFFRYFTEYLLIQHEFFYVDVIKLVEAREQEKPNQIAPTYLNKVGNRSAAL
jgi:hypothetical protein